MFGQFKIVAGDFRTELKHQFLNNNLMLHEVGGWGLKATKYPPSSVVAVEEVEADTDRSMGITAGWGVAGALVAGPLGAVAAGYLGGRTNDVVFICKLNDGKEFVGVMKKRMFSALNAQLLLKKKTL